MNNESDNFLRKKLTTLPREISPARDLWPGINAQLNAPRARIPEADSPTRRRSFWLPRIALVTAALLLIITSLFLFRRPASSVNWSVTSLAGNPRVDSRPISNTGEWRRGQWLETDARARARLAIGTIGEVRLEPNSRLRLLDTDAKNHRLELARGTLHALIWAPPRLFFVETPSATATDLGCAYTLTVDDHGTGLLHVTSGYVALANAGRETLVPAGMFCVTRERSGPGTPFSENAKPELRNALDHFDFAAETVDRSATVADILAYSTYGDEVTLWHLLTRVIPACRAAVFEKLVSLQPPPASVTREGILSGDKSMIALWGIELGLKPALSSD